jgi:hypothetical protein
MTTAIQGIPNNFPVTKSDYAFNDTLNTMYAQTPYCPGPQNTPTLAPPAPPFDSRNPGDMGPLGCSINSSGEDRLFRRFLTQNRGFQGDSFITQSNDGPIYIQSSAYNSSKNDPMFGDYNPELWMTPYDREEEKESMGVFTNPYTGETAELFQAAMPPPDTDKSILPSTLKRTNPQLIWMNGGEDPNAPRPNKKEICLEMPGADYGPNPWGTQLYADQIGKMQTNLVMRDVFNNRNGILPGEQAFNKEQPFGYVGLQNMTRWQPYLPPTQFLDIKDWVGGMDLPSGIDQPNTNPLTVADVFTRKVDLTAVSRMGVPEFLVGDFVPEPTLNKQTKRGVFGSGTTSEIRPNVTTDTIGGHVILDFDPRPTLKVGMEKMFPVLNAGNPGLGGHVVIDVNAKPTLKVQMEQMYPSLNANNDQVGPYSAYQGGDNELTRRQFYSDHEILGYVGDAIGDALGPGITTFANYRGYADTYVQGLHPSKVFTEVTDSQARWVGQNERDSKTEFTPNVGVADFAGGGDGFFATVPRCIPEQHATWKYKDNQDIEVIGTRSIGVNGGIFQGAF